MGGTFFQILFAGMWRPLVNVIATLYYAINTGSVFNRRLWYRVPSLHYVCIRRLGIILIHFLIHR